MLQPFKRQYFWLAEVYESIRPKDVSKTFLWARLGAKSAASARYGSRSHGLCGPGWGTVPAGGGEWVADAPPALLEWLCGVVDPLFPKWS
ncbi:hypothetical protein [Streptomyces rubiginosohelvolus]